jgi:hypothetical protein
MPSRASSLAESATVTAQVAKNLIWRAAYDRWPPPIEQPPSSGYTLLMPVPADLPVFLRLALANVAAQDPAGRAEILVVPDHPLRALGAAFEACKAEFGVRGLRLVQLPGISRALGRLSQRNPATNYFLQLHAGVTQVGTTHALLHDADLFLTDERFLARHYRRCVDRGLACLGVSEAWDDWLRKHHLDHVVATWELMFDVNWMRTFAPWRHRSHYARIDGNWHGFDVTLYTQSKTPPDLCELHPGAEASFVHFNWVIGVYRHFQRSGGQPIEDSRFVMLLIRLFVDALDGGLSGVRQLPVDVPSADRLARGLTDSSQPVTYRGEGAARHYGEFRAKIQRLYNAPLFNDAAIDVIERRLTPFDMAFG